MVQINAVKMITEMVFLALAAKAASLFVFLFQGFVVHLCFVSKPALLLLVITESIMQKCKKKMSKWHKNIANGSHDVTDSIIFISLYDKYFLVKNCNTLCCT